MVTNQAVAARCAADTAQLDPATKVSTLQN